MTNFQIGLAHLIVHFPSVFDTIAMNLSQSAFSEGIFQNEKVQFLELLQFFVLLSKVLVHTVNLCLERHVG